MNRIEHLSEGVTLYLGDCREILPTLGKVDDVAVVADVPYGIGYRWHGGGTSYGACEMPAATKSDAIFGDDAEFDPTQLLQWPCVLFGADYFCNALPRRGRWLSWDKRCNVCPPRSQSDIELIWCSEPGPKRVCYHMWDGMVRDSEVGIAREHPTQKPIAVMEWCIGFVPMATRIIDPYMGSGTTGVAAVKMGKGFIGIEIEPKYFDISCRRIEKELSQPRMAFSEPAPKPEQSRLGL